MEHQQAVIIREVIQPSTDSVYLSDEQIAKRYGLTRQSIWRWVRTDQKFPKPIRLSAACTRWKLSDIEAWEAGKAGA